MDTNPPNTTFDKLNQGPDDQKASDINETIKKRQEFLQKLKLSREEEIKTSKLIDEELNKKIELNNKDLKDIKLEKKEDIFKAAAAQIKSQCHLITKKVTTLFDPIFDKFGKFVDGIEKLVTNITEKVGNSLSRFWNNKLVPFFSRIPLIGVLFKGLFSVASGIFKVFNWVWTKAKVVFGFLYDKVKEWAKIGWEYVSSLVDYVFFTPVKTVFGFLYESFKSILSNPLSWIVIAGMIWYFWDPIKDFLKNFISKAWDFITGLVADWFFKGDKKEMNSWFNEKKNIVLDWISEVGSWVLSGLKFAKDFWDNTIGEWTGFSIEKITDMVKTGWTYVQNLYGIVRENIVKIWKSNVFDEIRFLWNSVDKAFRNAEDVSQQTMKNKYVQGSKTEYNLLLETTLKNKLKATLSLELFSKFLADFDAINSPSTEKQLQASGNDIISKFKQSISSNPDFADIAKKLSPESVGLNRIIFEILNLSDNDFRQFSINKTAQKEESEKQIGAIEASLNTIYEKYGSSLKGLEDEYETKNLTIKAAFADLQVNQENTQKQLEEKLYGLKNTNKQALEFASYLISKSSTVKDFDSFNAVLFGELNDSIKSGVRLNVITEMLKFLLFSRIEFDELNKEYVRSHMDNILQNASFKPLSDDEFVKIMNKEIPSQAMGGIIKDRLIVEIAEAGYPEMVIPLNKDGLEFISEIVKNEIIDINDENERPSEKNILKRVRKQNGKKSSEIIYNMKNISKGFIQLG